VRESDLKLAVSQYLEYLTNQGKLYADRLNSGAIYEKRGDRTYGVMLCREGTADFMVIRKDPIAIKTIAFPQVIFLELKGDKGKTSPAQNAFKILVEEQGAEYKVIRSIEDLEKALGV